jgi:short-subunit dehydrogenase
MNASQISTMDRVVLLGSSRGLGWATYQTLVKNYSSANYFLSSRKIANRAGQVSEKTFLVPQDFSKIPLDPQFVRQLAEFKPTTVIYFAGGGPHGAFEEKKWSDHQWALNTTFLYPAELIHRILAQYSDWPELRQLIVVGSAIAEANGDPFAASYAAAKHALKGLITSIQKESSPKPKLRLFSPGYMQTEMLPASSRPRQLGLAEDPFEVAKKLIAFIEKND